MKNNVNLCFVLDDGYAMPTIVTLISIKENKNITTIYSCYVIGKNISKQNMKRFKSLESDDFHLYFVKYSDLGKNWSNITIKNISATSTAIYKLCIPKILAKLNRVIFLDGDTIIQTDLSDLYNVELDDCYIAAVKDYIGDAVKNVNHHYFNSGVMLMNLQKMREDQISEKLLYYRQNGINFMMDQDAFNCVCVGKIKSIPFRYNTQMNAVEAVDKGKLGFDRMKVYWALPEDCNADLYKILNDASIIHFATPTKPWVYYDLMGSEFWLKYYYESPYKDECLLRKRKKGINDSFSYKIWRVILFLFLGPKFALKRLGLRKRIRFLKGFYNEK